MAGLIPRIKKGNKRASLNWTQMDAVIAGVSAIDLSSLAIRNRSEAADFAREYGFDIEDPRVQEDISRVHKEAIDFIEEFFLTKEQHRLISEDVRHPDHILDLLVYSSNYLNKSNIKQMWACAVLKVMHGIFHIDHDSKLMYFDLIKRQIFESVDRTIVRDNDQYYLVDDQLNIPIYFFEKKRNKGRKSILLKLLQKPSYVASDIYDHLGIRLVFESKVECLFALKVLRKNHLITVTNIKPFRSRNTLVDLKWSKKVFQRYRALLNRSKDYPTEIFKKMDQEIEAFTVKKPRDSNPHSSVHFQAIQVTARKMIRIPNPAYERVREIIDNLQEKTQIPPNLIEKIEKEKELSFYFDYEIQLLDKDSFLKSFYGEASHEAYKRRQRETAKNRVLGLQLIKYLEEVGTNKKGGVCV